MHTVFRPSNRIGTAYICILPCIIGRDLTEQNLLLSLDVFDVMYKHGACGISVPTTIATCANQKFGGGIDD